MPEQFGEKSHDATPFRRQKAREQGQVAKSQDLSSAVLLLAALTLLLYLGNDLSDLFGELMHRQFDQAWLQADKDFAVAQWWGIVGRVGQVVLPLLGLLAAAAVLANLGQTGILFLPDKMAPDGSRINPFKGIARLLSISNTMRLGFGLFKIIVVAIVAGASLWADRERVLALVSLEVLPLAATLIDLTIWTSMKVAVALLILALFDYAFQWWKHEQDLRMTTQEVREEMKTLQGDPQVIARRRAVQRQLVLNRLSTTVPQADAVVTNPTHLAVAIKYDFEQMEAPIVVAKGADLVAKRIRELAERHDIPVVERKPLARALFENVEVGEKVPAEQYAAVAEVLRYVYQLKGQPVPGTE